MLSFFATKTMESSLIDSSTASLKGSDVSTSSKSTDSSADSCFSAYDSKLSNSSDEAYVVSSKAFIREDALYPKNLHEFMLAPPYMSLKCIPEGTQRKTITGMNSDLKLNVSAKQFIRDANDVKYSLQKKYYENKNKSDNTKPMGVLDVVFQPIVKQKNIEFPENISLKTKVIQFWNKIKSYFLSPVDNISDYDSTIEKKTSKFEILQKCLNSLRGMMQSVWGLFRKEQQVTLDGLSK